MYLIFDTETTGLPKDYKAPISDVNNWPRCVQIAWQLHDEWGNLIENRDFLIKPEGFNIPYDSERIHGISTELAAERGVGLSEALEHFKDVLKRSKFVVGQNVGFDLNIIGCEFVRLQQENHLEKYAVLDTCTEVTAQMIKLPGGRGGRFKLPTLSELHQYLFNAKFDEAHNATADVEATSRCFLELLRRDYFSTEMLRRDAIYIQNFKQINPDPFPLIGLKHINFKAESASIREQSLKSKAIIQPEESEKAIVSAEVDFVHLHNHSQFSVLQSTTSIAKLVQAAVINRMPAVALTDTGNLMGAFHFVRDILKHNASATAKNAEAIANGNPADNIIIKPIVGCELNVCDDHKDKSRKDNGYQIVFLAKNKVGYHNLAKLTSIAYTQGFYYLPRVDRKLIEQYKEGLIVLSGNLYGEIPSKILNVGENQAEEALLYWKEQFGEDFYLEIMRHDQADENVVNRTIQNFSEKHEVKIVATNNTYYIDNESANAHDILLCVRDGEKQATPKGRGRGYRYGFDNNEYYFKSGEQMKEIFSDVPEAISNIAEIVAKVEIFDLSRKVLLPKFGIPQEFVHPEDNEKDNFGENGFLRHITYIGAEKRYAEITEEIRERIDFELLTISNSGYPGYFLIVQDFIAEARKMGVSVGPGRGSAAGSVVAYCLGITNIDPLKYNLLFERFLNPDRVSLPDIDIDFDDEGRGKVLEYVIQKYGSKQVAQIITYGTMAAKSAIRDTARVLDLPLFEADRIAKLIPFNFNLAKIFSMETPKLKAALRPEDFDRVLLLIEISKGNDLSAQMIRQARILEGNLRNTGIHACGVIITPDDITNFVPVATAKDSELYVTQFDNSVVESAGLLKMDFLGLKTLTIIKDAVKLVKYRTGETIDPDEFPIDDSRTYELFQRGETVGIFQYESPGMQKYMKELKPTVFGDLIAMNALYRPGPIAYIPSFIKRKNGEEEIVYDLDACEDLLKETYGITVYQEQVMLLSQKLAGFTKGDADVLRKAMGKKLRDVLEKMKPQFITQAMGNGHDKVVLEKIWKDWEAFAEYAFNKSHSTCYAWVAYQTAYLKANYPAEFMAAVLSNNMNEIKQVSFFMEECKRMGLAVLGPDVNESFYKFTVNENEAVRFGMGAIKGVGAGAVETIIENRKEGKYRSIFDVAKRVDLRAANKKAFENFALAGGFDSFDETHRAQYFHDDGDNITFLEKAIKYGSKFQENLNSAQVSLFGESSDVQIPEPQVPPCNEWGTMEKLAREKEVVGIYISGHPLDDFRFEIKHFCSTKLEQLKDLQSLINKPVSVAGIVTNVQYRTTAKGKEWCTFTLEGFDESYEFRIFDEAFLKFRHHLTNNSFVQLKLSVQDGYINRETGKKSDPRIVFNDVKQLHDVLAANAKKLTINLDVKELTNEKVHQLSHLLHKHKGDFPLAFDVVEYDESEPEAVIISPVINKFIEKEISDEDSDEEIEMEAEIEDTLIEVPVYKEVKPITALSMPSRGVRVEINAEILSELEKMRLKFKLV